MTNINNNTFSSYHSPSQTTTTTTTTKTITTNKSAASSPGGGPYTFSTGSSTKKLNPILIPIVQQNCYGTNHSYCIKQEEEEMMINNSNRSSSSVLPDHHHGCCRQLKTTSTNVHSENKIALYEHSPKENTMMNPPTLDNTTAESIKKMYSSGNTTTNTTTITTTNNDERMESIESTTATGADLIEESTSGSSSSGDIILVDDKDDSQTTSPTININNGNNNNNNNLNNSKNNNDDYDISSLSSSSSSFSNESVSSSGKSTPETTNVEEQQQLANSSFPITTTTLTSTTNNVNNPPTLITSSSSPTTAGHSGVDSVQQPQRNTNSTTTTNTFNPHSKKVRVSVSENPNSLLEERRNSLFGSPTESSSASTQFNNASFMQGDSAMILNEKLHQIFLPICLFLCYAYLIVYSTDYPISMSFLCIIAIVINFKYVRNLVQQRLVVWMIKHLSRDAATLGEIVEHEELITTASSDLGTTTTMINNNNNGGVGNTTIQQPTSPVSPTTSTATTSEKGKEPNTVPFYSSSDFWRFGSIGSSSSSSTARTSSSSSSTAASSGLQPPVDASYLAAKKQRLLEVYTCKVMIVVNIAVFFLRLLLCTKDYTVGWLMIGFLSSTVHNYSYIILQNALVDCRVHSYEAIMWVILSQHIVSVGIAIILSLVHHRYVEAFGTFCLLTVLNFMLNSVSYKLMNRLNTMKLMTSKLKEANRSKNALVSSISHEFRSPLMSISGSIELLLDTVLNAEQINYIKTIGSCSSILLTLIEDILQYSKLEKTNMEIATNSMLGKNTKDEEKIENHKTVFSLSDCLQHVKSIASSYASNFDVTIDFVTSKFLPSFVLGESVRLQQVLINLLTNSIKASSRNQVVTLAVEVLEDDNPEDLIDDGRSSVKEIVVVKRKDPAAACTSTVDNTQPPSNVITTESSSTPPHHQHQQQQEIIKTVVFKVIDHGCGIQKDIQKLLFKPFSSHNHSGDGSVIGTGLGLTILRKIIINMKGGISYRTLCDPSPNHGTTFCISIPFHLPDKKKKNSLKQIEEILRTNPIVNPSMSTDSMTSASGSVLDSKKNDDLGVGMPTTINSIDSEVQKTHLLHKALYIMKKRQSKSNSSSSSNSNTASPKHSIQESNTAAIAANTSSTTTTNNTMVTDIYETKILLAEDNPINLSVLKKLLQKGGFKNITTSANGFELIEAFRKEYHPIIVTDLHMPIINGIDAANEIRSLPNGDKTKIILLTADALMDKFNNMDSIDSCLNKPISKDDLNQAIISAIRIQNQEEEE